MQVRDAYNQWAVAYDNVSNATRDLEKIAAQQMLSSYHYRQVLELGCGTGKNTQWLSEKADALIALDFSEAMLAAAKKKVTSPRVTFQQADLTVPWEAPSGWADLITCSLVLEHIEHLPFIFEQAADTLKDGGHFYLCEYHPFKQYSGKKARFETEQDLVEIDAFVHHFTDYTNAAKAAGLSVVEVKEWFDNDNDMPRLLAFVFGKGE